jgi:haloalkane dehalogenase
MQVLRTPDECFESLPGYDFEPHYVDVPVAGEEGTIRMHYLDEGPRRGETILCMHGEPSWCYLYRKMIPLFVQAGYRVIAPDLVGFGRSDKPASREDHTYQRHVDWVTALVEELDLHDVSLVCQDWGGLIGLRVAAENEARFARIVVANTGLPTGEQKMSDVFMSWREFSQTVPEFPVGMIIGNGTATELPADVLAAYEAPFPEEKFKEGARQMPILVPTSTDDPASAPNLAAWKVLEAWTKPFLTAFSNKDPITKGGERVFQSRVPGAQDQPNPIVEGGGHFLQEDCGELLASIVIDFMRRN